MYVLIYFFKCCEARSEIGLLPDVRGDTLLMSARLKLITKPSSDLLIQGRAYQWVPRVFKFDALIMFELLKFDFFVLLSSAVGEKNVRSSNSSP